jgi:FMN phosphatase YigB (HAD superfamily)
MKSSIKSRLSYLRANLERCIFECSEDLETAISQRAPDVISVDFFDTLAHRRTVKPEDVFLLQYPLLPTITFGPEEWLRLRKSVEHRLAKLAYDKEVQLSDIYFEIANKVGWTECERDQAIASELQVEKDIIRPNISLVNMLREHQSAGRKIVITTDIYLPRSFVSELLGDILDFPFDLLCSSETNATKRSGNAFELLLQRYTSKRILHIGDNIISDYFMARNKGIEAIIIDWPRNVFLRRNAVWVSLAATLGLFRISTPVDQISSSLNSYSQLEAGAQREVAWRWAIVQAAMIADIRHVSRTRNVENIWFLSRDCESLYAAVEGGPQNWFGCSVTYVHTSRAASHPIVALYSTQDYQSWTGNQVTESVSALGRDLTEAYKQLAGPNLKRLLIVDTGWKGRVQRSLQLALPEVSIWGYYVSLDDSAEVSTIERSHQLIPWDKRWIRQAAAEALAGYKNHSCIGYDKSPNGQWEPVFKDNSRDRAPETYLSELRSQLRGHAAELKDGATPGRENLQQAFESLFAFPDQIVATAFNGWEVGVHIDHYPQGSLASGGNAGWTVRVLGLARDGNLWPEVAFWSVTTRHRLVWILQRMTRARRNLQRYRKGPAS